MKDPGPNFASADAAPEWSISLASPPSTMMVSTSPAPLRRKAAARSYSGEVKQATPCSKVGNSMTTKRWNLRPFHDLVAAAARQHLAAELGDDARHEIGVFLVFDGIIDLRSRNPIGRHGLNPREFVLPGQWTVGKDISIRLTVLLVLGPAKPYPVTQETADIAGRGATSCHAS